MRRVNLWAALTHRGSGAAQLRFLPGSRLLPCCNTQRDARRAAVAGAARGDIVSWSPRPRAACCARFRAGGGTAARARRRRPSPNERCPEGCRTGRRSELEADLGVQGAPGPLHAEAREDPARGVTIERDEFGRRTLTEYTLSPELAQTPPDGAFAASPSSTNSPSRISCAAARPAVWAWPRGCSSLASRRREPLTASPPSTARFPRVAPGEEKKQDPSRRGRGPRSRGARWPGRDARPGPRGLPRSLSGLELHGRSR